MTPASLSDRERSPWCDESSCDRRKVTKGFAELAPVVDPHLRVDGIWAAFRMIESISLTGLALLVLVLLVISKAGAPVRPDAQYRT